MDKPANSPPRSANVSYSWVLMMCTHCEEGSGSEVSPNYVGLGDPCHACKVGTMVTLRELQRMAALGRLRLCPS